MFYYISYLKTAQLRGELSSSLQRHLLEREGLRRASSVGLQSVVSEVTSLRTALEELRQMATALPAIAASDLTTIASLTAERLSRLEAQKVMTYDPTQRTEQQQRYQHEKSKTNNIINKNTGKTTKKRKRKDQQRNKQKTCNNNNRTTTAPITFTTTAPKTT